MKVLTFLVLFGVFGVFGVGDAFKFVISPGVEMMQNWRAEYSRDFENHAGYPITHALKQNKTFLFYPRRNTTLGQAVMCSPFGHPHRKLDVPREVMNKCLDFKEFLPYGFCFISVDAKQSGVLLNIAWWRQPWTLYVAFR